MFHRCLLSVPLAVGLLAAGCGRTADPVLQSGDVVRPEIAFAPGQPWPAGAGVALGMLVRLDRPGEDTRYLRDEEVNLGGAVMRGRVTFWEGDRRLGEPLEVPFVRDC